MTMDYTGTDFGGYQSKKYLESLGINPNAFDMFKRTVKPLKDVQKRSPGAAAFYDFGNKSITVGDTYQQYAPVLLHEFFHGLEDNLPAGDKTQLQELMNANPPEVNPGFTNYPGGKPTVHHNLNAGTGLSTYIDYNIGDATPFNQSFRSDVPDELGRQAWNKMPKPILDFLKERFPLNPSDYMRNGSERNRTTASPAGNYLGSMFR